MKSTHPNFDFVTGKAVVILWYLLVFSGMVIYLAYYRELYVAGLSFSEITWTQHGWAIVSLLVAIWAGEGFLEEIGNKHGH